MDKQQLIETLEALQAGLAEHEGVAEETQAALGRVTDDVRRVLDPEEETGEDDAHASREGLQGLIQEFEAEHPKLAETIGRIADGLANLGI